MSDEYKTILIDFDGVINSYKSGFKPGKINDPPINGAIKGIKALQAAGYKVEVCTSRSETLPDVKEWMERHDLGDIPIGNRKKPCLVLLDDRAHRFTTWKDFLNYYV